ncbi:MAG: hypothetical protein ACI82Z_001352 [Cellvibrionaceae bacterium]|jgi:hypothetical protein
MIAFRDKLVLDWEPGVLNPIKEVTLKDMHWRTFKRLTAQHDTFVNLSLADFAMRVSLISESMGNWI